MKVNAKKVKEIVDKYRGRHDCLVSMLQDVQAEYRYLPEEAIKLVADQVGLPLIQVYGVSTFFKAFRMEPAGKHTCTVCMGTACHVRGAPRVLDELERKLRIAPKQTTKDQEFTLETVNCLGACALGPIVVVDEKYHGQMKPGKVAELLAGVKKKSNGKKR